MYVNASKSWPWWIMPLNHSTGESEAGGSRYLEASLVYTVLVSGQGDIISSNKTNTSKIRRTPCLGSGAPSCGTQKPVSWSGWPAWEGLLEFSISGDYSLCHSAIGNSSLAPSRYLPGACAQLWCAVPTSHSGTHNFGPCELLSRLVLRQADHMSLKDTPMAPGNPSSDFCLDVVPR